MILRKLAGFAKPSNAIILAIIFLITLALFAFEILPGFDEINPYDETKYVDSGRSLLSGDVRELAWGPLVAFLYAPLYLIFRDSPDWFIIIDGIGRLLLFSALWISSIYVAFCLKRYVHPVVVAGVLLCSSYPIWLLRNPSDALFSSFSALALGKTLSFKQTGRRRDLAAASIMIGLAGASRPDGVFLLPFFAGIAIWIGRKPIGLGRSVALSILPALALLAAFVIARGISTGNFSTEIGNKGLNTLYWSETVSPQEVQAEDVYGSWTENSGSFMRAVSRSPEAFLAFLSRVRQNASRLPHAFLEAYGKRLGPAMFILAAFGVYSLVKSRERSILLIFCLWPLYSLLYLGFYLRPGFLLLSHFVLLSLSAAGASYSFSRSRSPRERIFIAAPALLLCVYGLIDGKPAFWAAGFLLFAALILAWISFSVQHQAAVPGAGGLLPLLAAGIILRGGYSFPGGWPIGHSSMERAIHFLQERLPARSVLAAGEPLPAVAANLEFVELSDLPTEGDPIENFRAWVTGNHVKALYVGPGFIRNNPDQWEVIQGNFGSTIELVRVFDPGSIRILLIAGSIP